MCYHWWTQSAIEYLDACMSDSVLSEAINCVMKLYWIESRTANSAEVVLTLTPLLFKEGIKLQTHRQAHICTFLAQRGWSQKFKMPAELILSPSACTSKDVWVSGICLQRALTGVLLCGTISWVFRLGKNLGAWVLYLSRADYSQWHGALPRGLGGKQPRPEKTRQALMPSVELWIKHFPGRPLHHMTHGIKVLCLQRRPV